MSAFWNVGKGYSSHARRGRLWKSKRLNAGLKRKALTTKGTKGHEGIHGLCDLSDPSGHDRMEREEIDFHHKVRQGYLELAAKQPERWRIIDSTRAMSVVQDDLRRILVERFEIGGLLEKSSI